MLIIIICIKRPILFQIDREVETTCNAPSVPKSAKKEVYQQLDDLKAESKHLVAILSDCLAPSYNS